MKKLAILFFMAHLLSPSICLADKIQGHACYTFEDSESLVQAEHTAKMLAIRNAIEFETRGQEPIARWGDKKMRKTEILPGEITWETFLIPDNAESWKVWVPK